MEAYNLPIGLRKWFVERLIKQLEVESEAIQEASRNRGQSSGGQTLSTQNQPRRPTNMR